MVTSVIATPSSRGLCNVQGPSPIFYGTDASVWLARTEQCLEQNGIPRDRGTSVACSFLSDDVYVQVMQLPLTVNERFAEFAKMFAERYSLVESTPEPSLSSVGNYPGNH
ncbi:hypothetical protein T08_14993 [Trichinella sp. T8]|nr:hypothetical protein T08_14993 [Trichinella sp. T8]